jgi:hypothetical protein
MASHLPAAEVARWQGSTRLWLDHAEVREEDLEWIAPAESLVLWNVRLPDGALARLPNLLGLSVRGGSGQDLSALEGCSRLICLDVNQVRGLHDLGVLSRLRSLEFLSLYGLPRLKAVPSFRDHEHLDHVQLGSLKGLETLAGVADAPRLTTLSLIRTVKLSDADLDRLASHPTLRAFDWFCEDVPQRVAQPVLDRLAHLERPAPVSPDDWLTQRLATR